MTRPEESLWSMLRESRIGFRFRRQHPIGPYILDFYCPSVRLCVEVDGPVHEELHQIERDKRRDERLVELKIQVVRVSAKEVQERPAAVIQKIRMAAESASARLLRR